jgi:glycerol dehydrogenase-like iron-containing ADH family enzyme
MIGINADGNTRVTLPSYTVGGDAYAGFAGIARGLGGRVYLAGGIKAMAAALPALQSAGAQELLAGVTPYGGDCTLPAARALADKASAANATAIAGMGGGRALDTAKAAASMLGLPMLTFPTIAATCAAVTALSVMYREDGAFDRFVFHGAPPAHAFLHTGVLAAAPCKYLRAGMGDSIAKHFECVFSARGMALNHLNAMGTALSAACWEQQLLYGADAMRDAARGEDSPALQNAVLANIVTTGLVSLLVDDRYNGALAHSLYYALESVPAVAHGCLHGDVVAYGVMAQLFMDGQADKAAEVFRFLHAIGTPLTLKSMGVDVFGNGFAAIAEAASCQPDMALLPYTVTPGMILEAVRRTEEYALAHWPEGGNACSTT